MASAISLSGAAAATVCGVPLQQQRAKTMPGLRIRTSRRGGDVRTIMAAAAMGGGGGPKPGPYVSPYAVPMEASKEPSLITRPLAEILRDMNKRVPEKVLRSRTDEGTEFKYIPWYHANRMLSFYAPGWSGEVRNVVFSKDGSTASVVYRVTIRGSDGETWREASGTAAMADAAGFGDPVQKAEGMAFRRACARFGLGLYLYHED